MTELRLDRELYDEAAVAEAAQVYGRFGAIERADDAQAWVVRVSHADPARERRLARELANHALGRTIERGGKGPEGSEESTARGDA